MDASEHAPVRVGERRPLGGKHTPQIDRTGSGTPGGLFGLGVFIGCVFGVPLLLGAVGVITPSAGVPRRWFAWFAVYVFLAVAYFWYCALVAASRRRRRARLPRSLDPWLRDHDWDPQGTATRPYRQAIMTLLGAAALAAFLLPFHELGLGQRGFPLWGSLVLGVFDIAVLIWVASAVDGLVRAVRYGTSYLTFRQFPFFLGEDLAVGFHAPRFGSREQPLAITLRCIQEFHEMRPEGGESGTHITPYILYSETQLHTPAGGERGTRLAELVFTLPQADLGTRINWTIRETSLRYWELEAHAARPGLDFNARFVVPVYGRQSA